MSVLQKVHMLDIKHILTYTWQSPPQDISPLWSDKLKVQTTHLHNCQILAKKDVLDTSLVSWQNISWLFIKNHTLTWKPKQYQMKLKYWILTPKITAVKHAKVCNHATCNCIKNDWLFLGNFRISHLDVWKMTFI